MFKAFKESSFTHLIILAAAIGAIFLAAKAGAGYLPASGFGGSIKRIVGAL
jgi:hypothetical protein